jgi:hypothetical protein
MTAHRLSKKGDTMSIATKFQSTELIEAPARDTRAEAEADDFRGMQLNAYLALLPQLDADELRAEADTDWSAAWVDARDAAHDVARYAGLDYVLLAARDTAQDLFHDGAQAAAAIVVRDLISVEDFQLLTAGMREAGVDFEKLG